MVTVPEVETRSQQINNVNSRALVGTLAKTLEEAQAETLADTLSDVETRILVKTLTFKLERVAGALVDTMLYTTANILRPRHFKTHKVVCGRKLYWAF